jgi:signal transduction histidine kinase/CheY-like chemotaxis protein
MHRITSRLSVTLVLAALIAFVLPCMIIGPEQASANHAIWDGDESICSIPEQHEHATAQTGFAAIDFLSGDGQYMARTHCMVNEAGATDWPWVWALIGLNLFIIIGYLRIFVFWRRAYLQEAHADRNKKLMDLAWIFLFCACCGYVSSIVLFFWPGYRLLALTLVPLAFFTWKFAGNLEDFRLSLGAKRLARQLNESLAQQNERLSSRVMEATADLSSAKRAAERANRAKGEFLARMSHEIRTPMSAVLGYVDIALEPDLDSEQRRECLHTIRRNSEHLLKLMNDVLDISKIEAGEMSYESIPCSIREIVADIVDLMKPRADAQRIAIDVDISDSCPELISTDPTRVKQMITNLVSNAIKFTEQGSVTIEIDADQLTQNTNISDGNDAIGVRVRVRDTGIGMNDAELQAIFSSFSQANNKIARRYGGTGLGLTISKRIANDLGGDLVATSTPGQGSEFVATIRAAAACAASDQEQSSRLRFDPSELCGLPPDCRVLLVEDGEDNRRLIEHHFTKISPHFAHAEDGVEGLQAALDASEREEAFDLILMDIDMPNMNGIECTRRIREAGIDTPIVMLSAHTLSRERILSVQAGINAYCTKPINFEHLYKICTRELMRYRRTHAA